MGRGQKQTTKNPLYGRAVKPRHSTRRSALGPNPGKDSLSLIDQKGSAVGKTIRLKDDRGADVLAFTPKRSLYKIRYKYKENVGLGANDPQFISVDHLKAESLEIMPFSIGDTVRAHTQEDENIIVDYAFHPEGTRYYLARVKDPERATRPGWFEPRHLEFVSRKVYPQPTTTF